MSDGKATKARSTFRMEVGVATTIQAPPSKVWAILTNGGDIPKWNSTVQSFEGTIAEGETIKLVVKIAPDRTFKLKVSGVVKEKQMVWSDGFAPMFKGVRTYALEPVGDKATRFSMIEVFSGLMLPMIAGSLPDFGPVFEQFAKDLQKAAEQG